MPGQLQLDAAALVARYKKLTGMTQEAIAYALGEVLGRPIRQGQVSDHFKGLRWSDPDLPGAYVKVLGIPAAEMAAAMGYPIENAPKKPTLADVVKNDPTLSPAAKKHLLGQYVLLQMATQHERSGDPVLKVSAKA